MRSIFWHFFCEMSAEVPFCLESPWCTALTSIKGSIPDFHAELLGSVWLSFLVLGGPAGWAGGNFAESSSWSSENSVTLSWVKLSLLYLFWIARIPQKKMKNWSQLSTLAELASLICWRPVLSFCLSCLFYVKTFMKTNSSFKSLDKKNAERTGGLKRITI